MKLISVYTAAGLLEADMIKALLEAQDFTVVLSQESLGRSMGLSAGPLGKVEVLVPAEQADEVNKYLSEIDEGEYSNFDFENNFENHVEQDSEG